MRGQFALLSLKWDCYLAVRSINLHETYLNTQLGSIYNDINIILKDREKDMLHSVYKKCIFHYFFFNINISLTIID